jgi:RND family efflux transporter MFP subunit
MAEIDTPELNQELLQARAQLFMAESAVPLAKATAARWGELVKTKSVSEQEEAEKASEFKLRLAAVDVAKANVARLEELQSFQKIKAPFDGIITARDIDNGQLVTANSSRELFRLTQNTRLRIFVRVPQTAARGVAIGNKAELTIPEMAGRVFDATVVRTSGTLTADSRTLLVELEVDNSKGEVMTGAYAQVRFPTLNLSNALQLPSNTLLFRPEGLQAGVVGPDGKVSLRTLTIGRDFGPTVEVLSGVSTNEQVILNPPDSLANGMTVRTAQAN